MGINREQRKLRLEMKWNACFLTCLLDDEILNYVHGTLDL